MHFTDDTLQCLFAPIESKVQQLKDYVAKRLQFQSLWDLKVAKIMMDSSYTFYTVLLERNSFPD
jgi:hypothetical protein